MAKAPYQTRTYQEPITLIDQLQDGYPFGGQVTAGAHIKPGASNSHTRPMSRRFYGPVYF